MKWGNTKMMKKIGMAMIMMMMVSTAVLAEFDRERVEAQVSDILGTSVEVYGYKMLAGSARPGDAALKITGDFTGTIFFSYLFFSKSPERATKELQRMYQLKKKYPEITEMWFQDKDVLLRTLKVGDYEISLREGWEEVFGSILIEEEECDTSFYIGPATKEVGDDLINHLVSLNQNPYYLSKGMVAGKTVPVFKRKGNRVWILQGRSSTLQYLSGTGNFIPGNGWDFTARQDHSEEGIVIIEGEERWDVILNEIPTDLASAISSAGDDPCQAYMAGLRKK